MDVHVYDSIEAVDPSAWDALAGLEFPFARYHFLRALETTDCLGKRTGWYPFYLVARESDRMVGALVAFAKTNGYGEYIFDWAWSEAAEAAGLAYYPKLTSAIPFTPATGPKLLLGEEKRGEVAAALLGEFAGLADGRRFGSAHALFIPEGEASLWREHGFLLRETYQFHWTNAGYRDFDDFLSRLSGKRRREIRRERAQVRAADVVVERLTGADLTEDHAREFYDFYLSTIDKRASFDYLTPDFFRAVLRDLPERVLLVRAEKDGRPVAAALNYLGRKALFGRHWGSNGEYRALHFELCYYQGLEEAIARGFDRFEAGAQGEHKLQRGFLPSRTYSAHRIAHPGLAAGVRGFVTGERARVGREIDELNRHSPFAMVESREVT